MKELKKCTDVSCKNLATEMRIRGSELIYFCEKHVRYWDRVMEICF